MYKVSGSAVNSDDARILFPFDDVSFESVAIGNINYKHFFILSKIGKRRKAKSGPSGTCPWVETAEDKGIRSDRANSLGWKRRLFSTNHSSILAPKAVVFPMQRTVHLPTMFNASLIEAADGAAPERRISWVIRSRLISVEPLLQRCKTCHK